MDQRACFGVIYCTKGECIHRSNWTRAHRENIAQNPTHAGSCALIGLDIGGVVVAFHFEHDRLTIANINNARVLAWPANNLRPFGW